MSTKHNVKEGGKKARGYGGGSGMHKHATSGVAHNHANTIAMNREAAKEMQRQAELKKRRKGKMYSSVKEALADKSYA